jgi:methylphosphotriester-DNA--protein-cysteine methyltransferase
MVAVFSTSDEKLSYIVLMLQSLKLGRAYDGLLFLADASRSLQRIDSHCHAELELNLILRGTATYVVNGRRFMFSPRTLLWLFPQQEHQLVDRSDNAQFFVAVFKPSLINRSCRTAIYKGLKQKVGEEDGVMSTLLSPELFDLVQKTMVTVMHGALEPELLNREAGFGPRSGFVFEHHDPDALNAGLRFLLLLCWRIQLEGKSAARATILHPAVRRALKLLSEDATEQNLGELARACGTSKSYLSRTFHRQIGVPLNRYRNSLRLARFFDEYRQPDQKNLAEAVYAAGFGSYAQFYKVFTQAYGRGPRDAMNSDLRNQKVLRP